MITTAELFQLLRERARIEERLREHPWVNNRNNPIAEVTEFLLAEATGGHRPPNNTHGYDVVKHDGRKAEVKTRVLPEDYRGGEVFGVIRNPDAFDLAVLVRYNMRLDLAGVSVLRPEQVREAGRWSEHQNGYVVNVHAAENYRSPSLFDVIANAMIVDR